MAGILLEQTNQPHQCYIQIMCNIALHVLRPHKRLSTSLYITYTQPTSLYNNYTQYQTT